MRPEQKQEYVRRYAELKKKGKSFYPYSIFKDTVASAVVLLVLLGLLVAFGVPLESKADPTNTSYIPRPEWYFMFLFEALKYFPGEIEWIGVVVVPGITLVALLLYPWLDRRPTRRPSRRPLSVILAVLTVIFTLFLIYRGFESTPAITAEDLTPVQESGKRVYLAQSCNACHSIHGVGGKEGPDLAGLGSRMDSDTIHQYIEDPKAVNPNAIMPGFASRLSHEEVEHVVQYLLAIEQ